MISFLLLGPPIGLFGFISVDQVMQVCGLFDSSLARPHDLISVLITIPILWLYGVLFSYLFGLIPALISGVVYVRFLRDKYASKVLARTVLASLIGAGLGLLMGFLFVSARSNFSNLFMHLLSWIVAGVLGSGGPAMLDRAGSKARA